MCNESPDYLPPAAPEVAPAAPQVAATCGAVHAATAKIGYAPAADDPSEGNGDYIGMT